jgi:hypothetical protein
MEKSVLEKIQDPHVENHYNMTSSNHLFSAPPHGGRVPNILDASGNAYASQLYKTTPQGQHLFGETNRRDLIGHMHLSTPLNEVFFSDSNIQKLQQDIQEQVLQMSGNKIRIGPQDEQQLRIIMRSYYLMYAKNNAAQVAEELAELNGRVVGFSAAKIYSEADFHEFYLKDLQEFAPPIANPMNVGVYGTRTGELKSFF